MKDSLRRHLPTIAFAACLLLLVGIRLAAIYERAQLHSDEVFSVMLARHNQAYVQALPEGTYSGAQLKNVLAREHSLSEDLASLHSNNYDIPHASMYYMALRVALESLADGWDAQAVARAGGWLNIIFMVVAFWAMWRIGTLMFGRERWWLTLAVITAAMATRTAVFDTMFVREYQMAQMWLTLLALCAVKICIRLRDNHINLKLYAALAITVCGALSTGYLNAIYVGLVGLGLIVAAARRRRYADVGGLVLSAVAAVALCWVIYTGFFNFLLHSTVHTRGGFSDSGAAVQRVAGWLGSDTLTWTGTVACIAIFGLLVWKKRLWQLRSYAVVVWLALGAIIAIFLTDYASVLHQARYTFPLLPLAMLLPGALIAALDDSTSRSAATVWATYYIALALLWPVRTNYGWQQMTPMMDNGAVFYRLNPNELPQAIPVLRDDAAYIVTSKTDTVRAHADLPIVTRLAPPVPIKSLRALTGPLKLYMPKTAKQSQPMSNDTPTPVATNKAVAMDTTRH